MKKITAVIMSLVIMMSLCLAGCDTSKEIEKNLPYEVVAYVDDGVPTYCVKVVNKTNYILTGYTLRFELADTSQETLDFIRTEWAGSLDRYYGTGSYAEKAVYMYMNTMGTPYIEATCAGDILPGESIDIPLAYYHGISGMSMAAFEKFTPAKLDVSYKEALDAPEREFMYDYISSTAYYSKGV